MWQTQLSVFQPKTLLGGALGREAYLQRVVPGFSAAQAVNRLEPGGRVMALDFPTPYYFDRPWIVEGTFHAPPDRGLAAAVEVAVGAAGPAAGRGRHRAGRDAGMRRRDGAEPRGPRWRTCVRRSFCPTSGTRSSSRRRWMASTSTASRGGSAVAGGYVR
ncbi:MAG: hypothetical protein AB2L07_12845, partial [Thermoanaerobaculaceae bacterium]